MAESLFLTKGYGIQRQRVLQLRKKKSEAEVAKVPKSGIRSSDRERS